MRYIAMLLKIQDHVQIKITYLRVQSSVHKKQILMMAFSSNLSKTCRTLEEEEIHSFICALDRFSLCWDTSELCTKSFFVNTAIKHLFLELFLSIK